MSVEHLVDPRGVLFNVRGTKVVVIFVVAQVAFFVGTNLSFCFDDCCIRRKNFFYVLIAFRPQFLFGEVDDDVVVFIFFEDLTYLYSVLDRNFRCPTGSQAAQRISCLFRTF